MKRRAAATKWREATTLDPALHFTALSWGATATLPGHGEVLCTPEFARIAGLAAKAAKGRNAEAELDLLVSLVEMAALGHSSHAFA